MFIRYESGFDGLLSAVAYCLRHKVLPQGLLPDSEPTLLSDCLNVATEYGVRRLFVKTLQQRIGRQQGMQIMETAWYAWLAELPGISEDLYAFIRLALQQQVDPSGQLYIPEIAHVTAAARKTGNQAHHYLGFLRFSRQQEFYLADFEPDCHVLPLIVPHFADRLADQTFVIRDLRRQLAALHLAHGPVRLFRLVDAQPVRDENPWLLQNTGMRMIRDAGPVADVSNHRQEPAGPVLAQTAGRMPGLPAPSDENNPSGLNEIQAVAEDQDFAPLWRQYLQHLSIPERRNLKLQKANMPKKYWPYLTEKEEAPQGASSE